MGLIDPEWYAARTDEEKQAFRAVFADRPSNELDVSINSLALLRCIERLLSIVMAMEGHNTQSLLAVTEAVDALKTASNITFSFSTDEAVRGIWGQPSNEGENDEGGAADE